MNPRAATFRDDIGEIVGTTWGGTICWYPRKPSAFVTVDDDGRREHVIRCGWCPGCLELDRRRLADRLQARYSTVEGNLWLIVLESPLHSQARDLKRLRRTVGSSGFSGMYRLGTNHVAAIAAGSRPAVPATTIRRGLRVTVRAVKRSRGRRAWNEITRGILIARDEWGQWIKRFYHRGLPAREHDRWNVVTSGGIRKRHAATGIGVRGRRDDVSLFPPLAWLPPRLVRRRGPIERRTRGPVHLSGTLANLIERLGPTGSTAVTDAGVGIIQRRLNTGSSAPSPLHSPLIAAGVARPSGTGSVIPSRTGGRGAKGGGITLPTPDANGTAAARRTLVKTGPLFHKGTGYIGSEQSGSAFADEWAARMKLKSEARAKGSKPPD
jgi:hypothetical protein